MPNIDLFIAGYIAATLFLTSLYMLFGVDRREPTDTIFTIERFAWTGFWILITCAGYFEFRIDGNILVTERIVMGTVSTVVLTWTIHLYERDRNLFHHISHFLKRRIRHRHDPESST